jgi:hypothetical protein
MIHRYGHFSIWFDVLINICDFFVFLFAPTLKLAPTLEHRADFSVSWSFTDVRTPWTGDQLVARPLPKHRKTHTHFKYPCPEWDSNPRFRLPSDRRQFMPQTARQPWPPISVIMYLFIHWHIKLQIGIQCLLPRLVCAQQQTPPPPPFRPFF